MTIKGWYRLSTKPEHLVARAPLHSFTQHWIQTANRSAACIGEPECILCQKGFHPQRMAALAVSRPGHETVYLLRFTEKDFHLLPRLAAAGRELIGRELEVRGSRPAGYDVASIIVGDPLGTPAAPCEKYLRAIGKKAYDQIASVMSTTPQVQPEL